MTSKKAKIGIISLLVILLILVGGFYWLQQMKSSSSTTSRFEQKNTPTLFFHGWGSSAHAEEQMTHYIRRQEVTKTIVRANVSRSGQVTWRGKIPRGAKNPLVEVNLENNKSVPAKTSDVVDNYRESSNYVYVVVRALQKKYHYSTMNLVGHSMGNLQIAYYLRDHAMDKKLPQLRKQVSIAGHYNGYLGESTVAQDYHLEANGRPSQLATGYRGLLGLRQVYPSKAQVLNLYGDTGQGSDGSVAVKSARSYRYLVSSRAKSYQEHRFTGPKAQHSQLHESQAVDRKLVQFLWGK
ncbi:alpha/beta hydrolase [Lactobacillus sp. DCY120]|uniref:Alpha/beta hydrolase n=1 Tax=Bombilactobacillus apium TaxID=2675299 RepID=A0A850QYX8_9LACO|nr:alpha/beta hydrolase [Bombilactobacillus apium]NVY95949.1 alpha/beta hydrolase [Bombilactobacillus apium]